jgi:DNA-binding MarR family transcriptional regulator
MKNEGSPLDWIWIQSIWMLLSQIFEETGERPAGISPKHKVILAVLDKQNTPGALRQMLGIPASTMTHLINDLEKANLIIREIHPSDRRQYILRRTKMGEDTLAAGIMEIERILDLRAANLSEEEKHAFTVVRRVLIDWSGVG